MFWPFAASNKQKSPASSREVLEDSFSQTAAPYSPPPTADPQQGLPPLPPSPAPDASQSSVVDSPYDPRRLSVITGDRRSAQFTRVGGSSLSADAGDVTTDTPPRSSAPGDRPQSAVEQYPPSLSGFFLEMLGVSSPAVGDSTGGPQTPASAHSQQNDLSDAFNEFEGLEEPALKKEDVDRNPVEAASTPARPISVPSPKSSKHKQPPILIPASVTRISSYPPPTEPITISQSAPHDSAKDSISTNTSPPQDDIITDVRLSLDSLLTRGKSALSAISAAVSASNESVGEQETPSVLSPFDVSARRPVVLKGRKEDTEVVLEESTAEQIRPHLPPLLRESSAWTLTYSMDQHGISLNTLYTQCEGKGPSLLCIKDSAGNVFGAFGSDAFAVQAAYYGTGSCFLWKKTHTGTVSAFHATGKNEYLILSEPHFIALGGGEGHFGLWIDDQLYNGHSGPCQTFANERLSETSEFEVVGLEVWGFQI
ncbi:TLD-domain-containing protein [Fimicolochytrium jonesii]|uniref:TLD-domain-containing protein n=1 Tax=Fimicolochytrium jonesii TaxID=1396493 RepID=UPI0022FE411A|nr:TLD-domain-containing protein [Fimicolochytrium jonesii]KAI8823102.1 TLD-domain-containing protein [Fimicolochytrium jonesii]